MDALHPHVVVRERARSHHRPWRGHLHLRRQGQELPRRPRRACSSSTPATAATSSPRPPTSRRRSWPSSRCGPTPTPRPSSSPSASRTTRRATSTRSSSPPAAARPSRPRGSWRSSTTSSPATTRSTRSSRARSPTTAPRRAPCPSPVCPALKAPFEPLVPGAHKVPNTNIYRAPIHGDDPVAFGRWAADQIEQEILFEGPETVAAVFLEPVQNAGGCFPPPPGYFQRVREICDKYDVLLVSDEVICAFGRLGTMFACDKFDYVPDMITCAKGMTSGYSPIGACIISDRLAEPFYKGDNTFLHGYTFGGHPVSAAVGLANLDIFEREGLNQHVLDNEGAFLRHPEEAARPADRRRRPRQRLLLRHRAGQGQGHQGDLQRRGDRARPVRLPLQGALRQRPVLPGRRPRRPGRPARPAADLRPGDLRRDRGRSCARS